MKVNELMVGDWVAYRSPVNGKFTPVKVENIYGQEFNCEVDGWEIISGRSISDVYPLGLTEGILVKNGFGKVNNQYFFGQVEIKELRDCWVVIINKEDADIDINIHYVHQLQHLLRLVGVQKEIEL